MARVYICLLLCAFVALASALSTVDSATLNGNKIVFSGSNLRRFTDASKLSVKIIEAASGSSDLSCSDFTVADDAITCTLSAAPAGPIQAAIAFNGASLTTPTGSSFLTVRNPNARSAPAYTVADRERAETDAGFEEFGPYATVPNGYAGVNWNNVLTINTYDVGYGPHTGSMEAFNAYASPATIYSDEAFTLAGWFRGAWSQGATFSCTVTLGGLPLGVYYFTPTTTNQQPYTYETIPYKGDSYTFVCDSNCGGASGGGAGGHLTFDDLVINGQPPVSLSISHIDEFNAGECSGPVTISGPAGATASYDVSDTMSTCNVFSDSTCLIADTGASDGNDKTVYLNCQASWYQTFKVSASGADAESNPFQVVGHGGGDICGDPHFVGYDGTKFDFNGKIGSYYNIYSDPHVSVNSLFISAGAANPYLADQTVNGFMAVRTHDFNITLDPKDFVAETNSVVFTFNGERMTIAEGKQIMMNKGCVKISFQRDYHTRHHHHTFTVMTQKFKIYAHLAVDNNKYVNATYVDYFISADLAHPSLLGGILGDSAGNQKADAIVEHQDKYEVADMFSVLPVYGDSPVCNARINTQSKREIDSPTCNTVPDGYRCYKHRTCSSGVCGNTRVCHPWGSCFVDIDCFGNGSCVGGVCQ